MNVFNQLKYPMTQVLFYLVALSLFFQALTWGGVYRFFAYLNLSILVGIVIYQSRNKQFQDAKLIAFGLGIIGVFVGLEWLATAHFPVDVKATRHLLLAVGLMCSIALIARDHLAVQNKLFPTLIYAVYSYTLFQLLAIYVFGRLYGTTKNPHYLAIYSAIFLVLASFLAIKAKQQLHQYMLIFSTIILGVLLLNTSSRPTWIALCIAILISIFCLRNKARLKLIAVVGVVITTLFVVNLGGFQARLNDLWVNAKTEERVTIWEDTWQMQSASTKAKWLLGHGVDSFERDFTAYSRYHSKQGIDFNSPHNLLLELLYQYGVVGLTVVLAFIVWLYFALFSGYLKYHKETNYQWVSLLLLSILTIDLIAVSITLPFFTSINLNVLALVIGTMFYLDRLGNR
jgi:O-antigen ligase